MAADVAGDSSAPQRGFGPRNGKAVGPRHRRRTKEMGRLDCGTAVGPGTRVLDSCSRVERESQSSKPVRDIQRVPRKYLRD